MRLSPRRSLVLLLAAAFLVLPVAPALAQQPPQVFATGTCQQGNVLWFVIGNGDAQPVDVRWRNTATSETGTATVPAADTNSDGRVLVSTTVGGSADNDLEVTSPDGNTPYVTGSPSTDACEADGTVTKRFTDNAQPSSGWKISIVSDSMAPFGAHEFGPDANGKTDADFWMDPGADTLTITETLAPPLAGQYTGSPTGTLTFDDISQFCQLDPPVEGARIYVCNVVVTNAPVQAAAPPPPPPTHPSIALVKTPAPSFLDGDTYSAVYDPTDGDQETIDYVYTVTNTGDVPLDHLTLDDDVIGTIPLPVDALAPGEITTVTATHNITSAEGDAGVAANTATASGRAPDSREVTGTDSARVRVDLAEHPGISLTLDAQAPVREDGTKGVVFEPASTQPANRLTAAAVSTSSGPVSHIDWTYTITNTGDVPLHGVTLGDTLFGDLTLATTTLDPGASTTLTSVYPIAGGEGVLTDQAAVTGVSPGGSTVRDSATDNVEVVEVLPQVIVRPAPSPSPTPEPAPAEAAPVAPAPTLPATGSNPLGLLLAALASIGGGTTLLTKERRLSR